MERATALVQHGPGKFEFEEFTLPTLGEGDVLVRVEANGLCASDVEAYEGLDRDWDDRPRILGHEIAGVIQDMGPKSINRQGLEVGDRVCVNPFVSCGICRSCLIGDLSGCTGHVERLRYGMVPTSVSPSLWGGYSTHAFVPRNGILYKVPPSVDALDATLWQPIAGGFEWAIAQGGLRVGDRLLVLGPGQRGLGAVLAARQAGAGKVVVTGLTKDRFKLDVALELGADAVIDVETEDFVARSLELSDGEGFDVILDTTPHAVSPINDSVAALRRGGTIMVIGVKLRTLDGFPIDQFLYKRGTLKAVPGSTDRSYRLALDLVASNPGVMSKLRTHVFGFDRLGNALDVLKGEVAGENAINVVVTPDFTS
ncbi:hypothetical protein ASG84_25040 [Rhodococcus sp. Leaf278]|uniref:zinc-dependent alcohol dehydrogenase n=1 Tax=Rhodococcus sp. Leaf278 TaxID=1736319 RepID=UPI0007091943|nr:alcohol dehydrogenase catalytic domain-containing protein [Rhodococcus sp. Leaf278]KQU52322.1 hypothetical protein ASG84_25040 [Rhodococcus sp. Leaf278]